MKITDIVYHRNGSGACEGFTQIFFQQHRMLHKNMMAIAFENTNQLAVIDIDNPTAKFDADYHRPALLRAIAAWEESWDSNEAIYKIKFPFEV